MTPPPPKLSTVELHVLSLPPPFRSSPSSNQSPVLPTPPSHLRSVSTSRVPTTAPCGHHALLCPRSQQRPPEWLRVSTVTFLKCQFDVMHLALHLSVVPATSQHSNKTPQFSTPNSSRLVSCSLFPRAASPPGFRLSSVGALPLCSPAGSQAPGAGTEALGGRCPLGQANAPSKARGEALG